MPDTKSEMALETPPSDLPPAYESPVIRPQGPNATSSQLPNATQRPNAPPQPPNAPPFQDQDLPPPGPPPSYAPKRTPSQEDIYIRELKAWAAEKSKMHPGAYGEYVGKYAIPARRPSDVARTTGRPGDTRRQSESRRPGEGVSIPGSSSSRSRVDSGATGERAGPGMGSQSPPFREGSFKRRMSSFMSKMRKQDGESGGAGDQNAGDGAADG